MAYLRNKGKYWYLVIGSRSSVDGKVKQKVLKYYGTVEPTKKEFQADIGILGTTNKTEPNGFHFDKVTKKSLEKIEGTIWRNKHTQDLAKIGKVVPTPRPREFEIHDIYEYESYSIDSGLRSPMAWVIYGEQWNKIMEHWYRVDHLSKDQQLLGYYRRIGYCREQLNKDRKEYQRMKKMSKDKRARDSSYTANLNMRKREWEDAQRDLEKAEIRLERFSRPMKRGS